MQKATIQLETLSCPSCIQKIEGAMKTLEGVDQKTVKVMFNASKLKVSFDQEKVSIEDIEKSITRMGYGVEKSKLVSA